MSDWQVKLAGLNKGLVAQEKEEQEKKAAVLTAFRKLLVELEPIAKTAAEFGDAFGVDCSWEISRFDNRYPSLRFLIHRPELAYVVECKDGVVHETLREGQKPAKLSTTTLEALAPRRFEQRITLWVQAAANANRKVPGKRSPNGR